MWSRNLKESLVREITSTLGNQTWSDDLDSGRLCPERLACQTWIEGNHG